MSYFLFILGRVLFGGYFIYNGLNHLVKSEGLVGYAQSKGVPSPKLAVMITGLMILLGGAGIVLWFQVQISAILIAIFLIGVSFKMHAFWKIEDPHQKMMEMTQFTKNMALLGGVLMTF